jgi:hypothetical protein
MSVSPLLRRATTFHLLGMDFVCLSAERRQ